jgi:hypothetical protein
MNKLISQVLTPMAMGGILTMTAGCVATGDQLPAVSEEGMKRVENTRVDALYVNPDADFSEFKHFAIADVDVSFRRNWLKDQNQARMQLSRRVSQQDANRIRTTVADSFRRIFTEELEKSAYTVVDPATFENSDGDLLLLHPDILDLDVAAPDVASPDRVRTYTACGCAMTLSLELYDAMSGTLLARVTDRRKAPDQRPMRIANSVTNKADADRIMRRWAKMLVEKLEAMDAGIRPYD